ncbi:ABC transporter substrate-binding protein [Halobacillus salinarum]|uniref:ABC transporter substrate-binding protein n=1 Tax=Halobacillus salinarum TaxID=2932257 RepID=A0ABY4EEP7_9BACI|nr:ABC transporter substrate-binding protein [Halobacillus salinarum]UOQ42589.1 ABC transporter substrate-binding protein [Halobacillus salinarum]
MKEKWKYLRWTGIIALLCLLLAACNESSNATSDESSDSDHNDESKIEEPQEQTITYLDKQYTIPKEVNNIATASLEAMEDAAVLGVQPVGTITVGGQIPEYLAEELKGAESIGEKKQPSYETLLKLKPDVIMGSSKFQPEVAEKLNEVAPMFPVSHISTNWEENLNLMAKLTGNKEKAEEIISQYKEDADHLTKELGNRLKDKQVVVARIRGGNIFLYSESVYFNPVLYKDLGLQVPETIKAVKAQEMISLEKFAEMNPDYLFVQFAESENADNPQALEELQKNPIWKSMKAVKEEHVFINKVDPMAQGGTAWSKTAFLKAVEENLVKQ